MVRILKQATLALLIALTPGCHMPGDGNTGDAIPREELTRCSSDGDCIMVRKTCCGCESGGESFSINRIYESYWDTVMNSQCGTDFVCTAAVVCTETVPACVNSGCTLVK